VVPANTKVVVEVEVTETGRDQRGAYAVADAWLWVDGKRIYSATNLGVGGGAGRPPPAAARRRASPLDATGARAFWRRRLGTGPGLAEDLVDGLGAQFVGDIVLADAAAFGALRGRPVVFLANHQVAVESLLFATLVPGLHDRVVVALAKSEHRETWMGQLMRLIARVPGGADPRTLVFFDRSDGASLLPILEELRRRMTEEDASLLVHVEGTRARAAGLPATRMSSVWIDLALAADAAVVPVRFTGGLPLAEAPQRLEFPLGYARQDYRLGRPLLPDELRPLDLAARQRRVLDAINALGPRAETPAAPDPAFDSTLAEWRPRSRSAEHAVLLAALAALTTPSDESRVLLEAVRGARAPMGTRWLDELWRWFSPERDRSAD
jgi:1-acyl-sn-glycerol-3-phosphate acyltransferase